MKKIVLVLTLLALTFSPLAVTQANAATAKHTAKHHRKLVVKKHAKRLAARKHTRKAT
jgi:hypothetical protein